MEISIREKFLENRKCYDVYCKHQHANKLNAVYENSYFKCSRFVKKTSKNGRCTEGILEDLRHPANAVHTSLLAGSTFSGNSPGGMFISISGGYSETAWCSPSLDGCCETLHFMQSSRNWEDWTVILIQAFYICGIQIYKYKHTDSTWVGNVTSPNSSFSCS